MRVHVPPLEIPLGAPLGATRTWVAFVVVAAGLCGMAALDHLEHGTAAAAVVLAVAALAAVVVTGSRRRPRVTRLRWADGHWQVQGPGGDGPGPWHPAERLDLVLDGAEWMLVRLSWTLPGGRRADELVIIRRAVTGEGTWTGLRSTLYSFPQHPANR